MVFLQEVWYKKDFTRLKDCTQQFYQSSNFDSGCQQNGNTQILLGCSGLMTLISAQISFQSFQDLPQGKDFGSTTGFSVFTEYLVTKKVLIVETQINSLNLRLINAHLSSFDKGKTKRN